MNDPRTITIAGLGIAVLADPDIVYNLDGITVKRSMPYWEASAYCQALGPGWRMPTAGEMRVLQSLNQLHVCGLYYRGYYWVGKDPNNPGDPNHAYVFNMQEESNPWFAESARSFLVRPVKDIKDK
jgi:hypothetical protein